MVLFHVRRVVREVCAGANEMSELHERLARLETEKISLERWLSQDPVALASGALLHASLPGIHGPVGRLLRTSGPYQRLLDRALGDRAHYFVADSLNDAQSAIRFLSDERKGWATFLVLDRLTQEAHLLPFTETMGSRSLAEPSRTRHPPLLCRSRSVTGTWLEPDSSTVRKAAAAVAWSSGWT